MMPPREPDLGFLDNYLEVMSSHCNACVDSVSHALTIDGVEANLRFHHLKFDSNGQHKLKDLARVLTDYVIEYAMSMRARGGAKKLHEVTALGKRARELFTHKDMSGEGGEMLLYFLLEAILQAPQVVAKMDLKTNPRMEVHGADGLHVKWSESDECLGLYFLESKLEKGVGSALRSAFTSITDFHRNGMNDHEINLVTSHFKHLNECEKEAVLHYIDRNRPGKDARINHACLIGYDYSEYERAQKQGRDAASSFQAEYGKRITRLRDLLQGRIDKFNLTHLRFEMFILPFPSVDAFRSEFKSAISR